MEDKGVDHEAGKLRVWIEEVRVEGKEELFEAADKTEAELNKPAK